jgi:ABC-2 type transport system ATP-binding protein
MQAATDPEAAGRSDGHDLEESAATEALAMHGVSKAFGSVQAVQEVDLRIAGGETIAILGPNGAGKTTTISLMLGLLNPDAGSVRIQGMPPREAVASGRIGAMLQGGGLTTGVKVRELVRFVHALYPEPRDVDEMLSRVGLADAADQLVTQLSGGQAQRLRLALAPIGNPEMLVLDEPTAGLDVEARRVFWASMHDYAASGRTVLFATHYLKEADEAADRIVVMAGGRIVADGPTAEIKAFAGGRTVRFALGDEPLTGLDALPGVTSTEIRGERVTLHTTDADATTRALLASRPGVHDLEVAREDLEDAFLALTDSN